jgi:tetratricopeptide (TPR) repeat protein
LLLELDASVELLAGLTEKGVVRRRPGGDYHFHHVLVREVAYASASKALRADLHERLADLLADRGAPDELIGHHLEQAHRLGTELRAFDARLRRLGLDAGKRLGTAGVEAWTRGDGPAAINLLTRACALLPEHDSLRLQLLCRLGSALYWSGELSRAEEVLENAVDSAVSASDRPREWSARLELASVRLASDPEGRAAEMLELTRDGIPVLEALEDDQALGRAWRFLADVRGAMQCQYAVAIDAVERALACYERCGWPTSNCAGDLAAYVYYGPTTVEEAVDRCHRLLDGPSRTGGAAVLTFLGGLEGMRGDFGEARRLVSKARRLYEDLGLTLGAAANCGTIAARIELLAGEPAAAEEILRTSCAQLERLGNRAYLATRAADLADVLWLRGCDDEAEDWLARAVELGASDDIPTQLFWRCAKGKVLARRGDGVEAEALVREAIGLADGTDALNHQAQAHLALAQVLGIGGRATEASAAGEVAIERFKRKGNLAEARLARAVVAEFAVV